MTTCNRSVLLASLLGGLILAAGCTDEEGRGRSYRPADEVPRLGGEGSFVVDDAGAAEDFDLADGRLYVLERFGGVTVLGRDETGWRRQFTIGRTGAGPGEFRMASGIAMTAAGLVVVEAERLHVFAPDGALLRTELLRLPCAMMRPSVAAAGNGILVHGNCFRYAHATDTMKAVLAWSPAVAGEGPFSIMAEEVRFTRDGTVGTIFGAPRALTGGGSGHLFGTGIDNCVHHITVKADERPQLRAECPIVSELYSAPPSAEVERRLEAGIPGVRARWPKALPAYVDRLAVGDTVILVRPFAADSVVLQTAAPESWDVAVAEFRGFVGCRPGGCLWSDDSGGVTRLRLLEPERLRALLAR